MTQHDHRHLVLKATGLARPPRSPVEVHGWLERLVEAVGMKVLMGPYTTRCETPGNEGVTGAVVIETSHASIHVWDQVAEPFLQLDLYSCTTFGSGTVTDLVREFGPERMTWMLIDRNGAEPEVLELGQGA